jgi:hypothetical protein
MLARMGYELINMGTLLVVYEIVEFYKITKNSADLHDNK